MKFRKQVLPTHVPPEPSVDDAWKAFGLVNDWIKHVETKTSVTIAAVGVTAGVLFNLTKDLRHPGLFVVVMSATCAALTFAGGICGGLALWPRLRSREAPTSTLYFHHIARQHKDGGASYAEALRALIANREDLIGEIAGQIWENAHVARKKYLWSNLALASLLLATGTLGLTAIGIALA